MGELTHQSPSVLTGGAGCGDGSAVGGLGQKPGELPHITVRPVLGGAALTMPTNPPAKLRATDMPNTIKKTRMRRP